MSARRVELVGRVGPAVNVEAQVWRRGADGELVPAEVIRAHNLVVNAGLNLLRDFMNGAAPTAITHFAIGTGTAAVLPTDTTLQAELIRNLITAQVATAQTLTARYFLNTATGNGSTLTEAGLFNAASSGDMYARVVLSSSIIKTSAIAVTFTWVLTWA